MYNIAWQTCKPCKKKQASSQIHPSFPANNGAGESRMHPFSANLAHRQCAVTVQFCIQPSGNDRQNAAFSGKNALYLCVTFR
jgi:hypothetical protein